MISFITGLVAGVHVTPVFVVTIFDVIGFIALGLALLFILWMLVSLWIKQLRCKHDGPVRETMACDAICSKCGKNLGFIETWREGSK